MEKKLEVKDLIISFRTQNGKVQAVRNINFDLYKGETLAIVGESGSGKSVTSRAIIGILAGNAIVESGEIGYDGQDLLKISEEDFHRIRGDKISMIFQDPLSSLNPIIKIGKQMTEAMLLKGKTVRRNAKNNFNEKLRYLNNNMDELAVDDAQKQHNATQCKVFDSFCINSTKLESAYNDIHRAVVELQLDVDNQLFLQSKKQPIEVKKVINGFIKRIPTTYHPDIVVVDEALQNVIATLNNELKLPKAKAFSDECVNALTELSAILDKAAKRQKPNYFTLGFYMMKNPTANVDDMPIEELTAMTRKYLDDEFMLSFIAEGAKALQHSHDKSIQAKRVLLDQTDALLQYFREDRTDKKDAVRRVIEVNDALEKAIDRLEVVKNSTEYTFKSSVLDAINKYFSAIKRNPKEQARFNRDTARYDALVKKGKTPDWAVVPASVTDLELAKKNIRSVIHNLRHSIRNDIDRDAEFNAEKKMNDLIEYLKEQASNVVYEITPKLAKAKALKLMEEVGIPEPAIRYNQYPFEFSGGMRQRIVIAIALAANPDILICDEPTTALDVTIQSQILELINRIKAERNLSVIFITHDLGVVANMADRIAVMYAGKIVEYGTADDIFYDPRHPYTWALLSSMPDLDTKEKLEAIPGTPPNMIYPPKGDAFAERNKYAMEIDFVEQPPLFQVSDTHYAATWLLHPDAPKVAPPKIVTDRIARMKANSQQGGSSNE